jgi:hypothetical protein
LKTKKNFFSLKNALAYFNAGIVAVNLKVVGSMDEIKTWPLAFTLAPMTAQLPQRQAFSSPADLRDQWFEGVKMILGPML